MMPVGDSITKFRQESTKEEQWKITGTLQAADHRGVQAGYAAAAGARHIAQRSGMGVGSESKCPAGLALGVPQGPGNAFRV